MKISKYFSLKNAWPFYLILIVVFAFFWKVILLGKIPLPADITTGVYYPWLDYKWGYDVGVPVKNPILSDVVSVIYPLRIFAVEQIKSGVIPLWNPFMFNGYPLLANFQIAIFSPTFFLYFIFGKLTAWSLQIILQPILASIFSYLLLRNFKLSKFSSVVGGLLYAFSGFNLIWLEWNAHALTAAFIPLVLLLTDKLVVKFKIKYAVLLSASVALLIFSGYPQLLVYTFMAIGLLMLFRKADIKKMFLIGIFLIFGVALSSVQTVPAFELLANSQRSGEKLASDLVFLPWQNLITFLVPDYFGNHATKNFWGEGNYTNNVGYSGLVTLVLAMIAIIYSRRKIEVKYLFSLLILSLILSLKSPISEILYYLKIHGSTAASATRVLVITNLSLAFLASFGIEKLLNLKSKKSYINSLLLPLIGLLIGIFWAVRLDNVTAQRNLVLPFIIFLLIGVLLVFRKIFERFQHKNKRTNYLVVIAISGLAIAELFRFGFKYTPFVDRHLVFPSTPVLEFLAKQKTPNRVFFGDVIPMNMWVPYGLESPGGYDAVYPSKISEYTAIANSDLASATPMMRHANVTNFKGRLFEFTNMKYALFTKDQLENVKLPIYFEKIFEDKSVEVYENKNASERAFIVYDFEKSGEDVFEKMLDENTNLNKKVFVDLKISSPVATQDHGVREYEINYKKYSPNESILEVETSQNGLLVVSDTFYSGWKAYVDNEEKEIIKTNFAFRGVEVSKGKHEVRFIYDPNSIKIGLSISLGTLIGLLLLLKLKK